MTTAIVVIALLVLFVGVTAVLQAMELKPRKPSEADRKANALHILEARYARGQIDLEELEERRRNLSTMDVRAQE